MSCHLAAADICERAPLGLSKNVYPTSPSPAVQKLQRLKMWEFSNLWRPLALDSKGPRCLFKVFLVELAETFPSIPSLSLYDKKWRCPNQKTFFVRTQEHIHIDTTPYYLVVSKHQLWARSLILTYVILLPQGVTKQSLLCPRDPPFSGYSLSKSVFAIAFWAANADRNVVETSEECLRIRLDETFPLTPHFSLYDLPLILIQFAFKLVSPVSAWWDESTDTSLSSLRPSLDFLWIFCMFLFLFFNTKKHRGYG